MIGKRKYVAKCDVCKSLIDKGVSYIDAKIRDGLFYKKYNFCSYQCVKTFLKEYHSEISDKRTFANVKITLIKKEEKS